MYFGEEAWRHLITGFRCRRRAVPLLTVAARWKFRIIRLFLTLKATARAVTFGRHQSGFLMAPWKRRTAANARSTGMRFSPEKRRLQNSKTGFLRDQLMPRAISMFPLRDRSLLRSAAAFVLSTLLCGRSWTCMPAFDPCVITQACPRR